MSAILFVARDQVIPKRVDEISSLTISILISMQERMSKKKMYISSKIHYLIVSIKNVIKIKWAHRYTRILMWRLAMYILF